MKNPSSLEEEALQVLDSLGDHLLFLLQALGGFEVVAFDAVDLGVVEFALHVFGQHLGDIGDDLVGVLFGEIGVEAGVVVFGAHGFGGASITLANCSAFVKHLSANTL
ncbi:MAG: hypothetical protein AN484_15335 [Aphanizomenon flos-aquae WA102]|uniref:Uncharacterized protein n=1 Tax=Aphanizomenon flos-aquae WA102 TaxID=1710896 RepID=A0A1B7X0H9_APHFL|nr:MAG: hypothetical protein AN484_15335 [Aphanizomenon flos-aquae WA102]